MKTICAFLLALGLCACDNYQPMTADQIHKAISDCDKAGLGHSVLDLQIYNAKAIGAIYCVERKKQ